MNESLVIPNSDHWDELLNPTLMIIDSCSLYLAITSSFGFSIKLSFVWCFFNVSASCPTTGGVVWASRQADTGTGLNCYLFTPYNNPSQLYLNSEALSYCRSLAVDANHVPGLLSVDTQAEKVFGQ